MIKQLTKLEEALRLRILTPEAEIIGYLAEREGCRMTDLVKMSKYSHACVFQKIRQMEQGGVVVKTYGSQGARTAVISLSETARGHLSDHIGQIISSYQNITPPPPRPAARIEARRVR